MNRVTLGAITVATAAFNLSCSKLTDPTYRFMSLAAIDGKALPATINFGPDSSAYPVYSGRLGFDDESLGLPCRIEFVVGFTGFQTKGISPGSTACSNGTKSPLNFTGAIGFIDGQFVIRNSGIHTFTFSGLITTKNP